MKRNFILWMTTILCTVFSTSCVSVNSSPSTRSTAPISLLAPSGKYGVGLKKYYFKDQNRRDPFLDGKSLRELMVNLYYPADQAPHREEVPYVDSKMLSFYKTELTKKGLKGEVLNELSTGVMKEPPFSNINKSYPLIILSPGSGVVPEFYLTLIRELVSHGFIVAGINHTHNAPISVFPDSSTKLMGNLVDQLIQKTQSSGGDAQDALIQSNAEDIAQTLEGLHEIDQKKHLDFSKLGMLGHSLGGMAVTYVCLNFPICKAGVNMDGPLLGASSSVLRAGDLSGDLKKPFLFLAGKMIAHIIPQREDERYNSKEVRDSIFKLEHSLSLDEYYQFKRDRWQGRITKAVKKMGKNTSLLVFENAEHMAFSDWRQIHSYLLKDDEKLELLQFMSQINILVTNFFVNHLQGKHVPLLKGIENHKDFRTDFQNE